MTRQDDFSIQLLGDQAVLAGFQREDDALRFTQIVRHASFSWVEDVVQAYKSVAVFFTLDAIHPSDAAERLTELVRVPQQSFQKNEGDIHLIPCCYEMGLDWEPIRRVTGLERDDVIRFHSETVFIVYAIGFCPGFPYLGYLPNELQGVPRLESPRVRLDAGSVGLTGNQTGIYTLPRPGGWNIIARTPLQLVDVHDGYFPLDVGDRVQFRRIDEREFRELEGERL